MEASAKSTESFLSATGYSMSDLTTLIAGIVVSVLFLWSAWVALSYYEQWAANKNNVSIKDVFMSAIRSAIMLLLIIAIVT